MDTELAVLASSGATVLIGRMVTDGWEETKIAIARFFGRHGSRQADDVAADLESARAELQGAQSAGNEAVAADIEAEWRSRLRRLLTTDPAVVDELKQLLDDLNASHTPQSQPASTVVSLTANASGQSRVYQVGHGDLRVGGA